MMTHERPTHLIVSDSLSIPMSEFHFSYVRSSGPGGQNVNKVNSQVQLAWNLNECQSLPEDVLARLRESEKGRMTKTGVLRMDCQRYRDREKNREDCLEKVRNMVLDVASPPKKRRKSRIPRGAVERRLRSKQQRSGVKDSRRRPRLDD
ncbi:alternative ribosome rescue aminoacyl-tRNA hydrolase ArfB [Planctomicrobium sp. SH661]|uniref:alternative ribosome rescue aminoacyl-tRNA hydrolase ArfB n=1 Tax=Planctomicrobium sp. SH661 TaxID=3448124 RepID=UPI003F5B8D65